MLYNLSERIIGNLFNKEDLNTGIYIYGMELLISSAIGTILLLVIGIIFDVLIESLIFIVGFSMLRIFSGGFHSRSFILCNVITLLNFGVVIAIYRYYYDVLISPLVYISVFGVTFALLLLYAPVVNPNNPINYILQRKCKIKSLISFTIEIVLFITLLYFFKVSQTTVLLPTFMSVDIFMIIPLLKKE